MSPEAPSRAGVARPTALADPTRRAILQRLADGEATVGELAEPFAMSMPAISKHLKVLEGAGLTIRGRNAQWRPRRIDPAPLQGVDDWLESHRRLWSERLQRLDGYLQELQRGSREEDRHHGGPGGGPVDGGPDR